MLPPARVEAGSRHSRPGPSSTASASSALASTCRKTSRTRRAPSAEARPPLGDVRREKLPVLLDVCTHAIDERSICRLPPELLLRIGNRQPTAVAKLELILVTEPVRDR